MNHNVLGHSMSPDFTTLLNELKPSTKSISDLRYKVVNATDKEQVEILLEDIKYRTDLCLETRCEEDKNYYDLLRAYCYLILGKVPEAINATSFAISGFRTCGLEWEQIISHWFLGNIYAFQGRGYHCSIEIERALEILDLLQQDYYFQGKYDEVEKYRETKYQLEHVKAAVAKMGTGPLYTSGQSPPIAPISVSAPNKDYLILPWIPQYHAVRAGPEGIVWADPYKESRSYIHKLEIEGKSCVLRSTRGAAGFQITLTEYEHYGVARVEGQSMNASYPTPICGGDYILFRIHSQPRDNDIVIASKPIASDAYAYMVKRYREIEKELLSETNDASIKYPAVKLSQDHQILGIVIAVAKPDV